MLHIQCIHFWVEYICLWSFSETLPLLLAKGKDLSLLLFLGEILPCEPLFSFQFFKLKIQQEGLTA